ncbi:MAG: cyclase family protein [Clostridia bacterium]|nr:cyclase family protein [Clostridia bacterium]
MKIYDITQEVFGCTVFAGDPAPKREVLCRIEDGDVCNLTAFSMCAHNGTHVDAPYHFFDDKNTVEAIPLSKTVGYAYLCEYSGILSADDARNILDAAASEHPESAKRILIKGDVTVSADAARVFAEYPVDLIGNESQTVGPLDAPMEVHRILLEREVVLLEGIRLDGVPAGVYLLSCSPLPLGGADGAPCRAVLIEI